MQGYESFDREFLDTTDLWHLVPEGSVYRFLAENRRRLFPDEMFADLFGPRGRPSIPGPVIAAVMVLQALECLSDREAIQRLRRDIAWKAAAGLSLTHGGFHPTVLTLWRARLRASEKPERIFDAVRQVVTESGVLATRDRRALDSTILHDAVATQDTVTMISAQIRRCRRLIPEAADLALIAHDYESKTKPSCDWSDPDSRSELVDGLVTDGLAVIEAVNNVKLDPEQADALGLLGVVTGQDVEPDPHREGRWRIARRVAKDRTISTVDPEARHGHKTRTSKRDGYKAHVATEPETGLVTAAVLTAANTPDADNIGDLVADQPPGTEIVADSAYASGAALETFDELKHTPVVKPIVRKPHIKDGYHRDDFCIDTKRRTVTCPAGHTTRIRPGGTAPFSKRCNGCPLRARCTTSERGRTITVDKHHDRRAANKARWAKEETQDTYRNLRPSWNGPSPGSPATKPDAFPTEESPATSNGSPPEQQPSTYNASPTSDSPTPPPAGPPTPPRTPKPGRRPQRTPPPPSTDPKHPPHKPQPAPPHQNTPPSRPTPPHPDTPIIGRLLEEC